MRYRPRRRRSRAKYLAFSWGRAEEDCVTHRGSRVSLQAPIIVIPHIKSGKLKAIAISGETRLPALSQVPTFTESGLPGYEPKSWNGILAPAGTPKEIVEKLSAEVVKIMAAPAFREELVSQGAIPYTSSPTQFAALIKSDT